MNTIEAIGKIWQAKVETLTEQNKRLTEEMGEYYEQIIELKKEIDELERDKRAEAADFKTQIERLEAEKEDLKNALDRMKPETLLDEMKAEELAKLGTLNLKVLQDVVKSLGL